MILKPGFDDEFQPKEKRWSVPVRSIGHLMLVVAVCGVSLALMAGMGRHKRNRRHAWAALPQPLQTPRVNALAAQPRDPFVVTAAAEIDAQMVLTAPAGIDEAMVFNPYTGGEQQPGLGAPVPGSPLTPLPVDPQDQAPNEYLPQWPAPAQPR